MNRCLKLYRSIDVKGSLRLTKEKLIKPRPFLDEPLKKIILTKNVMKIGLTGEELDLPRYISLKLIENKAAIEANESTLGAFKDVNGSLIERTSAFVESLQYKRAFLNACWLIKATYPTLYRLSLGYTTELCAYMSRPEIVTYIFKETGVKVAPKDVVFADPNQTTINLTGHSSAWVDMFSGSYGPDWASVWKCAECGTHNYWRVQCSHCRLPKDPEHDFRQECEREGLLPPRSLDHLDLSIPEDIVDHPRFTRFRMCIRRDVRALI